GDNGDIVEARKVAAFQEARAVFEILVSRFEVLVTRYPDAPEYWEELAMSHVALDDQLDAMGWTPPKESCRRATAMFERRASEAPRVAAFRFGLAAYRGYLGDQ